MESINCGIAGVTGYAGRELLRLLLTHPNCRVTELYSHGKPGERFSDHHPQYRGWADHELLPLSDLGRSKTDVLFLALPTGKTFEVAGEIADAGFKGKIIDLSADFRLSDPGHYREIYGGAHGRPDLQPQFIYGVTELDYTRIIEAQYLSNPGCFATALQMLTYPIAESGFSDPIAVTGLTGSTGSGAHPSATTHHPERYGNFRAYKVLGHRHMAEVSQRQAGLSAPPDILFTPVSAPVARGIWMTATFPDSANFDISGLYEQAYHRHPLVRLKSGLPAMTEAVDTPLTVIGTESKDGHTVAGIAIDNLLKGAASQAIQNMNLMSGLPEETGLVQAPKNI